jgi:hypothetical protein
MPFGTKGELKDAIASWLIRAGDTTITSAADDFIALLEARLNRWQPPLRVAEVDAILTATVGSRLIALPADFREPISLDYYGTAAGTPSAWAINGTNIEFDDVATTADTFLFHYRGKFALAADGDTNWLLQENPDVYLFGSLVEAGAFMKAKSAPSMWNERFTQAMNEIGDQDSRSKSLAPLTVDPALVGLGAYDIYTDQ